MGCTNACGTARENDGQRQNITGGTYAQEPTREEVELNRLGDLSGTNVLESIREHQGREQKRTASSQTASSSVQEPRMEEPRQTQKRRKVRQKQKQNRKKRRKRKDKAKAKKAEKRNIITVMYNNINGQSGNMWEEICERAKANDADVICLTETHWKVGHQGRNIDGYRRYWRRRNPEERKGGGIAMYVKENMKAMEWESPSQGENRNS